MKDYAGGQLPGVGPQVLELTSPSVAALIEVLRVEEYGDRCVGFLVTAFDLLGSGFNSPRLAQTVAYCLREAIEAVLESSSLRKGRLAPLSHRVVRASKSVVGDGDASIDQRRSDLDELLSCISDLEQFLRQPGLRDRQLEDVFIRRTGFAPAAAVTERFLALWRRLNGCLHNKDSDENADELWSESLAVLRMLFMQPEERFAEIERLAQIDSPSSSDHEALLELLTTPVAQRVFFREVRSLAWLPLLHESGYLSPPPDGGVFPAAIALERFAADYPDAVRWWLETLYEECGADKTCAYVLARTGMWIGEPGFGIVLKAIRDHPKRSELVIFGMSVVKKASPQSKLVERFADVILNEDNYSVWSHVEPLLERLAKGANEENGARRIRLLRNKLRSVPESDFYRFDRRFGGSINDIVSDTSYPSRASVTLAGLLRILDKTKGLLSIVETLEILQGLPSPLSRVSSWLLAVSPDVDRELLVGHVEEGILRRSPTGDDLLLMDRVINQNDPSLYTPRWHAALGTAPRVDEVGRALASRSVPQQWLRARRWVAILPREATREWSAACSILAAEYGQLTLDDFRIPQEAVKAGRLRSPMSAEELHSVDPLKAAARIAAWRPDPQGWTPYGARQLGQELESVVKDNLESWTDDPLLIVTRLRHPTYISHYLRAIAAAGTDSHLPVDALLDVIGLVRTHPWPPSNLGSGRGSDEYDTNWRRAEQTAVDLIKAFADADTPFGERAEEVWCFLERQVTDRSEPSLFSPLRERDPSQRAINRPCTRALEAMIHLIASEYRLTGTVSYMRATDIFEQSLRLTGTDGEEYRAILAPHVEFFRLAFSQWTEQHLELFFGSEAPGQMGQLSFDEYIKWGQPKACLLQKYRSKLRDAVRRNVDRALYFMLLAMLDKTPGYSIQENIDFLSQPPPLLSQAGATIARLVNQSDAQTQHLTVAVRFWKQALKTTSSLAGFGWFSEVKLLDSDLWAQLTLETLRKSHGRIHWGNGIIERIATMSQTETTLEILNRLLERPSTDWEDELIAEQAPNILLSAPQPEAKEQYLRLQRNLRDRGLIDQ